MSDDGRSALCSGCGNACAYFPSIQEGDEWWHIQCRQSFEIERLKVSHARLEKDLSEVRANAEAEIEALRDQLGRTQDELRRSCDVLLGCAATRAVLRSELAAAWAQLRSDHTHDPDDEGTLAEEIATLQRVWHAAEDDLSRTRSELNTARKDNAEGAEEEAFLFGEHGQIAEILGVPMAPFRAVDLPALVRKVVKERDEAMALVGEAIKASARYVFDAEKARAERDDALAQVKRHE